MDAQMMRSLLRIPTSAALLSASLAHQQACSRGPITPTAFRPIFPLFPHLTLPPCSDVPQGGMMMMEEEGLDLSTGRVDDGDDRLGCVKDGGTRCPVCSTRLHLTEIPHHLLMEMQRLHHLQQRCRPWLAQSVASSLTNKHRSSSSTNNQSSKSPPSSSSSAPSTPSSSSLSSALATHEARQDTLIRIKENRECRVEFKFGRTSHYRKRKDVSSGGSGGKQMMRREGGGGGLEQCPICCKTVSTTDLPYHITGCITRFNQPQPLSLHPHAGGQKCGGESDEDDDDNKTIDVEGGIDEEDNENLSVNIKRDHENTDGAKNYNMKTSSPTSSLTTTMQAPSLASSTSPSSSAYHKILSSSPPNLSPPLLSPDSDHKSNIAAEGSKKGGDDEGEKEMS